MKKEIKEATLKKKQLMIEIHLLDDIHIYIEHTSKPRPTVGIGRRAGE